MSSRSESDNHNSLFWSEIQIIIDSHPLFPPDCVDGSPENARRARRQKLTDRYANEPRLLNDALQIEETFAHDEMGQLTHLSNTPNFPKASKSLWIAVTDALNQFEPLKLLSTGGTSEVSLCRTRFSGSTVVVKRLTKIRNPVNRNELVLWEFQTLLKIPHPNIVQIYDAGTLSDGEHSYPYIAMEYIEGVTLRTWIDKRRAAAENLKKDDFDQSIRKTIRSGVLAVAVAAGAVQYSHDKGIVHGDQKPDNLMIRGKKPLDVDGECPTDESVVRNRSHPAISQGGSEQSISVFPEIFDAYGEQHLENSVEIRHIYNTAFFRWCETTLVFKGFRGVNGYGCSDRFRICSRPPTSCSCRVSGLYRPIYCAE